jgi:hypothetical protein
MTGGSGGSSWLHPTLATVIQMYSGSGMNPGNVNALSAVWSGIWTGAGIPGLGGSANINNASPGLVMVAYTGTPKGSGGTIVQSGGNTYHVFVYTGANQYFYP